MNVRTVGHRLDLADLRLKPWATVRSLLRLQAGVDPQRDAPGLGEVLTPRRPAHRRQARAETRPRRGAARSVSCLPLPGTGPGLGPGLSCPGRSRHSFRPSRSLLLIPYDSRGCPALPHRALVATAPARTPRSTRPPTGRTVVMLAPWTLTPRAPRPRYPGVTLDDYGPRNVTERGPEAAATGFAASMVPEISTEKRKLNGQQLEILARLFEVDPAAMGEDPKAGHGLRISRRARER